MTQDIVMLSVAIKLIILNVVPAPPPPQSNQVLEKVVKCYQFHNSTQLTNVLKLETVD
jgi:hypothetical protein